MIAGFAYKTLLAVSAVLLILFGIPYLFLPFFSDQTWFQIMGGLVLGGAIPYRDFWGQDAILMYYTNALAIMLFGKSMVGFRAFDLLYLLGVFSAMFIFVRSMYGKTTAILSCLLYGVVYFGAGHASTGLKDGNTLLFLFLGSALYRRARITSRHSWYFGAGFFFALSCWIKYPAVVYFMLFLLFLGFRGSIKKDFRGAFREVALLCSGFLTPCVMVLLYLGANGALQDLYEQTVYYNMRIYPIGMSDKGYLGLAWEMVRTVVRGHSIETALFLGALLFLVLVTRMRAEPATEGFPDISVGAHAEGMILAAGVIIQTLAQKAFWTYRMLPLFAILSIYLSLILMSLWKLADGAKGKDAGEKLVKFGARGFLVLFLGIFSFHTGKLIWDTYSRFNLYLKDSAIYYNTFRRNHGSGSVWRGMQIAQYLEEHTARTEHVLVWNSGPLATYLIDRPTTNFPYVFPLTIDPNEQEPTARNLLQKWRRRFIEDFDRTRPKYVVISLDCVMFGRNLGQAIKQFPELDDRLGSLYEFEQRIGANAVLRLKEDPTTNDGKGG